MSVSAGPMIVTNNLLLNLDAANIKSYPISGNTWSDVSNNARNGTFVNPAGITYSTSNSGCLNFSVGSYITVPHDAEISSKVFGTSTNFTLSAWVFIRSFSDYATLVQKAQAGSYSNSTCGLWVENAVTRNIRLVIGSNVGANPAGSYTSVNFSGAQVNTWYYVVGTGNGNSATLYINGQNVGSTLFSNITVSRTENGNPITIGTRSTVNTAQLDGLLSCVSVHEIGLSEDQVKQNFEALRGRFGL